MPDSLFPLRFTPFEFYFLLEDRPGYRSVFPVHLECRGELNREALARAYQQAHARHPLLSARIARDRGGWPNWIAGEAAPIRWADGAICARLEPGSASDGLQMLVATDDERTVISFLFPHTAADGIGGFQFIIDLMVAYAHQCAAGTGDPAWWPLVSDLLRDRDGHQIFNRGATLMDLIRIGRLSTSLLLRRAATVSARGEANAVAGCVSSTPDYLPHTLSEAESSKLSRIARKLSVRLNDLLVRDYFLMLGAWNRGSEEERRPIRILVPTNERRKQDYRMPAANVFSFAFLSRRGGDCASRQRLLRSVHEEMALIKRYRRGLYYEAGLRIFCACPPLLRWSLNRKWPFATAVFTNLGGGFDHVPLPWRDGRRAAGDLVFESGYGAGPIRPDTRLSIAVHRYAGQMSFTIRCDSQVFGPGTRRALRDAWMNQIATTLESET